MLLKLVTRKGPFAGVMFIRLKPYEERTASTMHSTAVSARLMGAFSVIPDGTVMAVNPPAISGLGQVGGFAYVLEALQGQTPPEMAAAMRGLVVAANQKPELRAVFSTFEAETPLVRLDIDRDKTRTLNISLSDVFAALQATLGGYYVNDFNFYGRTWTVRMQAEEQFRSSVEDISAIYVRNSAGEMTPLSAIHRGGASSRGSADVCGYRHAQSVCMPSRARLTANG